MKTEWGVDESQCIYCRKQWTKYDIDAGVLSLGRIKRYIKCDMYDFGSNHYDDQVCVDCYEKEALGLLE